MLRPTSSNPKGQEMSRSTSPRRRAGSKTSRHKRRLSTRALGTAAVSAVGAATAVGAAAAPADAAAHWPKGVYFAYNHCLAPKHDYYNTNSAYVARPNYGGTNYVEIQGWGTGVCGNSGATGAGTACVTDAIDLGYPIFGWQDQATNGQLNCPAYRSQAAKDSFNTQATVTGVVRNDGQFDAHDHTYDGWIWANCVTNC